MIKLGVTVPKRKNKGFIELKTVKTENFIRV